MIDQHMYRLCADKMSNVHIITCLGTEIIAFFGCFMENLGNIKKGNPVQNQMTFYSMVSGYSSQMLEDHH